MGQPRKTRHTTSEFDVPLNRESFLRSLLANLADSLENVIGLQDASGFISIVGQRIGEEQEAHYRNAVGKKKLDRTQVAAALVDFKRRIEGDFYIIEESDEKIVLGNRVCPYGERVRGHPSLCMMTSSVFGVIAAQNLGYARVVLEDTIAQGSPGCRVVVWLKPPAKGVAYEGREYFEV